MRSINRMPKKGEKITFFSDGMFPECDNRTYVVLGKFRTPGILNIQDVKGKGKGKGVTQVIARFTEGFNKYLHFEEEG